MAYPVTFDVQPPREFDKAQVALRILIVVVLAILQINGIIFGGAYLILPVVAAIMIAQKGAEKYIADAESGPTTWVRYLAGIYAYMGLATDKLPFGDPKASVNLEVQANGTPSVGSALLRIILGIPHAIVLGLLGIVFGIVWLIAAISILISGKYPDWAASFIQGYLRWNARVLAYMASLVDEYPPFSFDSGMEGDASAPMQPAEPPAGPPASQA
jgi:hypothetical protein